MDILKRQIGELQKQAGIISDPPKDFPYLPPYYQAYFWRSEAHYFEYEQINILDDFKHWSAYLRKHSVKNPDHLWHKTEGIDSIIKEMIDY